MKNIVQSKDEDQNYQEYRPMTAISIPIFNKKRDEFNKVRFILFFNIIVNLNIAVNCCNKSI